MPLGIDTPAFTLADIRDSTPLDAGQIKQLPPGTSPARFVRNRLASEGVTAKIYDRTKYIKEYFILTAHDADLETVGESTLGDMVVEIVDHIDRIEAFLPVVDEVISEGLATIEKVHVRFYRDGKMEES